MKKKGYTLIELIIALSIITVLMIGYFNLMFTLSKTQNKNDVELTALIIAQNEIEKLHANHMNLSAYEEITQQTTNGNIYNIKKEITLIDTTSSSSKYSIKVIVTAKDINPVELITFIYCFHD